jgi:hypothetical protein
MTNEIDRRHFGYLSPFLISIPFSDKKAKLFYQASKI